MSTEQLEGLIPDTAEQMAETIRNFSRDSLAELATRRAKEYELACADFDQELTALAREGDALGSEIQSAREALEAKERITRFEADKLILQGKSEQARAKLAEVEASRRELARIEGRRGEIAQRVREIESEKTAACRKTAEDFRDCCINLIRGAESGLAGILDATRDTLNTLELQVGASLYQPNDLTAGEKTNEWFVLHKWYRGRG